MKKFFLSGAVIVIFTIYALHLKEQNQNEALVATGSGSGITPSVGRVGSFGDDSEMGLPTATPGASPTPPPSTPTQTQTPSSPSAGRYKNGTYVGATADAFYGNVQVQVTISGGNVTNVKFLQYPSDRSTSQMINSQAMPYLIQEAISAQSAQVDGVSGATATSQAFIQSLGDALTQAS